MEQTNNYQYDLKSAEEFGVGLLSKIGKETSQDYLVNTKVGEMSEEVLQPLMQIKKEVTGLSPLEKKPRKFLGFSIGGTIMDKIEESTTKVRSIQSLLDRVESESREQLKDLENNMKSTTNYIQKSGEYIIACEEHVKVLENKINEVQNDSNPDKIAKDYYLQLLKARRDDLMGAIAMIEQQREQTVQVRGASLVASQKLRATINIGIPLLSGQLAQGVMIMKLQRGTDTINALSTGLTEISQATTNNWSKAMIETAEQSGKSIIDVETLAKNREVIASTTDKLLEIQQAKEQNQVSELENEMKIALDNFRGKDKEQPLLGSYEQSLKEVNETIDYSKVPKL